MKKTLLVALLTFGLYAVSHAQNMSSSYTTAIGAKGYFGDGSIGGLNVKHFLEGNTALEGSLLFKSKTFIAEGLYEWHGNITGAQGLKWYVGPGAQLGSLYEEFYLALKGTVGLDYKFSGAPITIAFDVNPTFSLTPGTDFSFFAGVGFRFAL
ncbi:hypothetical protein [Foetidibacter luteolus]|uniref:hypothetical protein n=1 Tax=Foetidibacter luteolus TaxID=2608880 RepID=UPI00129A5FD0|nr:hypothetical protein [Foetidibacter luteolus]